MTHLRNLSDDFYGFDADAMTVTGSTTGYRYVPQCGMRMRWKHQRNGKQNMNCQTARGSGR